MSFKSVGQNDALVKEIATRIGTGKIWGAKLGGKGKSWRENPPSGGTVGVYTTLFGAVLVYTSSA